MDSSNEKSITEMLIRLEERFTSEKSARRTREDQTFHRLEKIESEHKKLEKQVVEHNRSQEEFMNQIRGSLVILKYVYPIINLLLAGLATLAFYLFYQGRIEVEQDLREDIRILQEKE